MYVQLINIEYEYEINMNMYVLLSVLNYIEHKFTWNKNKSYVVLTSFQVYVFMVKLLKEY
jgi:hypothetical protein